MTDANVLNNEKQNLTREDTEQLAKQLIEYSSAMAEGLPDWTLEPPQIIVRRKKRF